MYSLSELDPPGSHGKEPHVEVSFDLSCCWIDALQIDICVIGPVL